PPGSACPAKLSACRMNHMSSSAESSLITRPDCTCSAAVMLFTMSKPRIIGGTAKGRELDTPASGTRPSPARLREALFSVLAFEPHGAFLDLCGGSGAIGLEAASRGWRATCVELAGKAAAVIQGNAKRLGLNVTVVRGDALAHADAHPGHYQVLFAAPPYPDDL